MSSRRDDLMMQALAAGAGALGQGISTLSGVLRRTAQALDDLNKVIEAQTLAEMEEDLDVTMEDDERFPIDDDGDLDDMEDEENHYSPTDDPYVTPTTPPVNP